MNLHESLKVDLTDMPKTGTDESNDKPHLLSVSCSITHGYIKVLIVENENYINIDEKSGEVEKQSKLSCQETIFRPDSRVYFKKNEDELTSQIIFPTSSCGSVTYKVGKRGDDNYLYPRSLIVIAQNDTAEDGQVSLVYNNSFDNKNNIWSMTDKLEEANEDEATEDEATEDEDNNEINVPANKSCIFTFQFKIPQTTTE